ncbi:hypothetical protein P3X46_023777 [Hevea brasiliensis]|uniref:Protein SHORTAGE IN CHIASMATA 1 n=1 Tax=Hevea brasiliensis TaxID=3981 RepID=A0ABQ9LC16_HEVBR|nr:protein SHORTAGE IN CHIASMATA 1 isoform X3 [Hevea brasiliensis]KAJ9164171.1 hypothetical protein P3X46_023777 [Hevea brasiliensis]
MRTRFLNTDYFTSYHSPNETLSFLNLPVPHLPPCCLLNFEDHFSRFDPEANISLEVERLPIDSAFSKFISQVIPGKIDVDYEDFEDHQLRNADDRRWFSCGSEDIRYYEKEAKPLFEDTEEGIQKSYRYEALEKDSETTVDEKHMQRLVVIQFEAPELDEFSEEVCLFEETMEILSEVPEIVSDPDSVRPGLKMQYFEKVKESVYSVEDVTLEYDMDVRACVLEDDDSGHEHMNFHCNLFPLLEVDEISLRTFTNLSMEDELLSFLENMKTQWSQNDNLLRDGKELLGSMQYDVLELLSNHCLSKQCLETELASTETNLVMDITGMVEKTDSAYCSLSTSPFVFQEFEFLEVDSSQIYEVFFKMQATDEPETSDWMFRADKNFKNFNELIVSCELALVDDTFKSMLIPIQSDHDKIRSLHAIVEEILAELKPKHFSASDGIYLDWHLLEDDKCNSKILSLYQNTLELDLHNIDFDWESFDKGKWVVDVILSDEALNGPKVEEHKESLVILSEGVSSDQLMGVASSMVLDDKCSKSGNWEHLGKENAGKEMLLFKSMSKFNDLEFFLNPGKVTGGDISESAVKEHGTNAISPKEGESHSILQVEKNMDDQKLKEVLNVLPTENKHYATTSEAADKVEPCYMPMEVPNVSYAMKSEKTRACMMPFPDTIVVVNTQNLDKEMIVSRRSTYQKILAMEKEGLQVLERDLDLPVDVVIISAICLVWYHCRNIRKKATTAYEASSCLPFCIENIATNVLPLLSFTFSCCILVFEGEINFLSTVMESSDGLYATAASLGIDLQLFCSYSSELTDEIILSNILYAAKLCRGIYPKMPESETLAESFLTKFPSVNPLTAHAILSSGGMLIEFFEWSNEQRILAVQHYHVPEESIVLFSAFCSYGEREDSKSIMTDCSSSVSSGPDSNKCDFIVASETKPLKCIHISPKLGMHMDDTWQFEPLNQFPDDVQGPSGVLRGDDCWMSRDTEKLDDLQWPRPFLKDLFGQKQGLDIAQIVDSSTISKPYDSQNSKGPVILDEVEKPRLYLNDKLWGQNEGSERKINNKVDWNKTSQSENLHEDFLGEVIDLTDILGKDVPPITNSMCFSTWLPETEQDSTRKSATRRLSFGKINRPTFPTAAAINPGSDLLSSVKVHRQSLHQNSSYADTGMPLKHPKKPLEDILMQGSVRNTIKLALKEEVSPYGGTPLSKAIYSDHPQPGSPWTIEFLNRIREKRMRQQSLPRDASTPDFGCSGSISKVTKRRSPSILEFFKYKGGSNPGKMHNQKKQKQSKQLPSSSNRERSSAPFLQVRTPIDKRSRQTLSFAMNDSGSQTRLVWSDGSANLQSKRLRKQ